MPGIFVVVLPKPLTRYSSYKTGEVTTQAFDDVIVSHGFDHENPLLKDCTSKLDLYFTFIVTY
jgi:hypothetical protein